MSTPDDQPRLHVDDDWKAQAQAEKQKLAEQRKQQAQQPLSSTPPPASEGQPAQGQASSGGRQIPPADFKTLVSTIATQALYAMGAMADPQTGERFSDLDIARHHVDTLAVLEEKTKGNLDNQESKLLMGTLYELRSTYVKVSNGSRSPATGGPSE